MRDKVRTILKEWLQSKDDIVFTDDIAIEEVADEIVEACRQECTIPVVSGSLPLASDEEIQKYVTERFSESHLLPEIIAFRAIKYYQQGMPPVSGRRCCLDESEGKQ